MDAPRLSRNREFSLASTSTRSNVSDIHEALFRHIPVAILYQNNEGQIEYANPAAERILGYKQARLRSITRETVPWNFVDSDEHPIELSAHPGMRSLKTGLPERDVIMGLKKARGRIVWLKANSDLIYDTQTGDQCGVLTSFFDISEERRILTELESQTERTQIAIESAEIGIWDWLPESQTMIWDKKLFQIYGYDNPAGLEANEIWENAVLPEDLPRVNREIHQMLKYGSDKKLDFRAVWPDGTVRHLRSQAHVIKTGGRLSRIIGVTHDVTRALQAEKKLRELAYKDTLTGIYSRAGFNIALTESIANAQSESRHFSVFILGLSRFKEINDNHGLSVGDKVLTEVAKRLGQLVGKHDIVARIGGDEFALVLEHTAEDKDIISFVHRLRSEVLKPIILGGGLAISVDAAIGISVFPDDGCEVSALQTNAGLAMQKDRMRESTDFMRYSPAMSQEVARKFHLKDELLRATRLGEFQLYYQPIIDLQTKAVVACEALIRWRDKEGRFVPPNDFIPLAEESGLICELGDWINITSIKQWKLWQELRPEMEYISINVSPRQLEQETFVQDLIYMVRAHAMPPNCMQLEITEGTFLKESLNAGSILHQLAEYGFRLAIDDFGTGYSSLAYLKRFNVDVIKIDRSFIRDIETDKSDRDIVSAILAMNNTLGFKTLVEGVETEEQNRIVHELGCNSAQGYLYGKPTFADEFAEMYFK